MTSRKRRASTKRNKPDSPSSSPTPSSSEENNSPKLKQSTSSASSSSSSKKSTRANLVAAADQKYNDEDMRNSIPFITPQHIKKEMGMMKLNGHVNDLDNCFSENSILFGKEINSSRKRSIVSIVHQQDENFKKSHLKQSNNSTSCVLIGAKKRKQTRPVQAPVPSFQ